VRESLLDALFREFPRSVLEADTAVCFALDEKLRLISCNPAWDLFATENGAPDLCAEMALGKSVLDAHVGRTSGYLPIVLATRTGGTKAAGA
jgi:hypothetical protein